MRRKRKSGGSWGTEVGVVEGNVGENESECGWKCERR